MSKKTRLWRGIQTFEDHLEAWENTAFESLDVQAMETEILRYNTIEPLCQCTWTEVVTRSLFVAPVGPLVRTYRILSMPDIQRTSYIASWHLLQILAHCPIVGEATPGQSSRWAT